jgi:hypothetical protein
MAEVLTKQKTIEEIVKQAKKLNKKELQVSLYKLRIKKMQKEGVKPAANPAKGIKEPTMEEINRWTHEARNYVAKSNNNRGERHGQLPIF